MVDHEPCWFPGSQTCLIRQQAGGAARLHPDIPDMILAVAPDRASQMQAALQHLERRFGLQAVQSAVLTSSNAAAAVAVNWNPVLCACAGRCAPAADSEINASVAACWFFLLP